MAQLVSTGQITIVDNNDARPITAYITCNPGPQQVYTKDESMVMYTPDWTTQNGSTGNLFTAKVYIGSTSAPEDITGVLTNRKWSLNLVDPIVGTTALVSADARMAGAFVSGTGLTYTTVHDATGSTLKIKSNMLPTIAQVVLYFEGDYTDPVTGLVSHVIAQISLGLVKTGTNAVFIMTRGQNSIEQATGTTKNVAVVAADLVRAAGIDTTGVTYRFFENNGATQIITGAAFNTKYGLKTTATSSAPTGAPAEIGVNLPASGAWSTHNTLVIHESAVADFGVYRVEAKDSDGTIYQSYFTIYDVTDPYDVKVQSSAGDKLQNGVGSTNLTPSVYYGATAVTNLTGWTFNWYIYNRDGKRVGFVDPTRTAVGEGRGITVNTAGTAAVFTYDGAAITFAAGDIIKVLTPAGADYTYEVASATGNTVTIRAGVTNVWLTFTAFAAPTASQFVGGKLFVVSPLKTTSAGASITVTGNDIDAKGNIVVEAFRP